MMTSKYEGHTPGPWANAGLAIMHSGSIVADLRNSDGNKHANAALIAAAPCLLAERDALAEALRDFLDEAVELFASYDIGQEEGEPAIETAVMLRARALLAQLDRED